MIVYWLKVASIICLWLVTLVRLPHAVRHREQRALWTAVTMIAVVLTLYMKDVSEALDTVAPAYVVYLGTHVTSVMLGSVVLYLILVTTGRRRFGPLLYTTATVTIVLLVALYLAAGNLRPTKALDLSLGYWLVLAGFNATARIASMALCWYCGQKMDHWMLKLGLSVLGTGFALLAVPWLLTIGWFITRDEAWDSPIDHIDGVAAACIAIGAILPLANAAGDAYRTLCAYGRLGHLWRDLTNTAPSVVFPHHSRIRQLLVIPGQLTLYRRIIEIRDAITILRNYTTPEVVQAAEQRVAQAAFPTDRRDAVITACWLAAAQNRLRQGHPAQAQTLASVSAGGDVLAQETDFLVQVANAYKSPLTTDFMHHLPVEPAISRSSLMKFIQLIDYKTTRVDEVQALLTRWIEETGGVRTATHTTVGRDRDDAAHFIEILQFPSYEEAMRNSNLPETNKVHEEFASLCIEYPKFINLDVIRDERI